MLYRELLAVALGSLRLNKLRSFLTMLGVIIGIASVIAMIALGTGAQHAVQERISRLGTTLLQIDENYIRVAGVQQAIKAKVTASDAKVISDGSPHIIAVQLQQEAGTPVRYRNRHSNVRIQGVTANLRLLRTHRL